MIRDERWFIAYVVAFVAILAAYYPSTYAIEDEFNILSLATAISRGTVLLERAGLDLDADLLWNGHRISKFSPFHAALFTPAVVTSWRIAFAVTALFAIAGAFVTRGMLRRQALSSAWVALYFLCAGLWFYSRTLMAAVPASVMMLLGASLLLRDASRPAAAGVSLSVAGLFHPWMIPVAAALSLGWWLDAPRARIKPLLVLVAGALPGAAALLAYNAYTTGSPFLNAYTLLGTQYGFRGEHVPAFLPLYAGSLLVMPIAGWAALSRRWSGGLAIPFASATVLLMASFYYYRDGLGYGIAGLLPGQRFLLPASLLACVPAARWLSHYGGRVAAAYGIAARLPSWAPGAALACFVFGFTLVSVGHRDYLDAHASVQQAIRSMIPDGSRVLVGDRAFKEFAPVLGEWRLRQVRDGLPDRSVREGAYAVWIGPPGSVPPGQWLDGSTPVRVAARSWIWKRDVWIAPPAATGAEAAAPRTPGPPAPRTP